MHPQVRWVLTRQAAVAVVAAAVAGAMLGLHAAVSALLGGGVGVASGYAYVWRAMRTAEVDPGKAFRAQVAGEGLKFAVTLLLFALVFKGYEEVAPLPLFLAFAATIVVYWMALLKQR